MSVMYDGVNPDSVPAGAQVYAGYVNGNWPSYNALVAKYPNAQHVSITVNSSGTAQVLDVESGDAAAVDVPGWLNRMRAAGVKRPTIYCSRIGAPGYGWQNVIDACHNAGVALPDFWIADYTSGPHSLTLDGIAAVAVQWTDHGGYDESIINDPSWPGGSTPPSPPTPPQPTPGGDVILPTLQQGSTGGYVKSAQALLRDKCGQNIAIDGVYGPATTQSVKNLQAFFKVPGGVDGILGPNSWSTLLAI
jgi:Putative peptidoglycan binding domain